MLDKISQVFFTLAKFCSMIVAAICLYQENWTAATAYGVFSAVMILQELSERE
jgi:hypothetical protein